MIYTDVFGGYSELSVLIYTKPVATQIEPEEIPTINIRAANNYNSVESHTAHLLETPGSSQKTQ